MKFRVKLKAIHDKSGKTAYRVAKEAGVAVNTVTRYIRDEELILDQIETTLAKILEVYGLDWRDPSVVETIYESGDIEPEIISPSRYSVAMPA